MDWSFTEEQEQLAALTRQILDRELTEERRRSVGGFDEQLYQTLTNAGVLDPSLGVIETCRVLVEVGRAVAPIPAAATLVAAQALDGGDARGLATLALVEDLNPDLERPTTVASDNVLNGTKTTVPAGTIADVFVVSATLNNGEPGLFAVRRDIPGVDVREQLVTSIEHEAVVELADASAERQFGGAEALRDVLDRYTVALCAMQLGVCERALELTAEYSKQRVQFDRPIATFQAVGQRLADAFIDVEGIRLTLWQAAWRLAEGLPADTEIAVAKFWAADAGHRVAHTAVHVHGGVGIDLDYPLHRYFVAAKRIEFALGAATDQLRSIGKTLATEPA